MAGDSNQTQCSQLLQVTQNYLFQCEASRGSINQIRERSAEERRRNDEVLKEIKELKDECSRLEQENNMKRIHNDMNERQIELYQGTVLPQLQNQLAQKKELLEAKRKEYSDLICHYEKIWEEYEIVYERFPRAAERKAIQNKVKILRIEAMKKRQEMIEKAKQVHQLTEIKTRRLEILQQEFQKWHAIEQDTRLRNESLQREIKEQEERIAQKEANKQHEQQQLQQEIQRQKETTGQQYQQPSETASAEIITTRTSSLMLTIDIPELTVLPLPSLECFKWPAPNITHIQGVSKNYQNFSMPASPKVPKNSTSQPTCVASRSLPMPKRDSSTSGLLISTDLCVNNPVSDSESQRKFSQSQDLFTSQVNPQGPCEKNTISQNAAQSLNFNKKELVIITDDIAANMQGKINATLKDSHNSEMKISSDCIEAVPSGHNANQLPQDIVFQQKRLKTDNDLSQPTPSTPLDDTTNFIMQDIQSNKVNPIKSPEIKDVAVSSCPSDPFPGLTSECSGGAMDEDTPYDFGTEYEEISLASPPVFDDIASPVRGSFRMSPAKSECEGNVTDSQDQQPSFKAFDFYSGLTNLFGGNPSSSDAVTKNSNPSSSFSFMF